MVSNTEMLTIMFVGYIIGKLTEFIALLSKLGFKLYVEGLIEEKKSPRGKKHG